MTLRRKIAVKFVLVIFLALVVGLISYPKAVSKMPRFYAFLNKAHINLGLDLQGGIHLEYAPDLSQISDDKKADALSAIQDTIERRVNAFGVAEPVVYTTKSGSESRLIVELAGIKDIDQAKSMIKDTPFLEFKEQQATEPEQIPQDVLDRENAQAKEKAQQILNRANPPAGGGEDFAILVKSNSEDPGSKDDGGDLGFVGKGEFVPEFDKVLFDSNLQDGQIYPDLVETQFGWHIIKKIEQRGEGDNLEVHAVHILIAKKTQPQPMATWVSTGLTGKNLKSAVVEYQSQGLSEPVVSLQFDSEGTRLFDEITKRNVGKPVAIYLDNEIVSAPNVNEEISTGRAQISGNFTLDEAKNLVKRLNEGALPVPISLISQQSVEASLGAVSLAQSMKAGIIGLAFVVIFMLIYYRFLGLIASVALLIYTGLMISIFKLSGLTPWSITLTLPGIAGFVLSIGMAVDANILIFERTKEEIGNGRNVASAIEEGFKRAWTSIRDGNISSIITAFILINLGTGFVKGFAVTLVVGVLVSMFTAVVISKTILEFLVGEWMEGKLWLIGAKRKNKENIEK
ncbi:MAG: protein translocase subunit SecD [Candidatus Moranbacteria bacterium]|nr:protein translocase subunit SecD [Candidatus Moranbacteria bacterium]